MLNMGDETDMAMLSSGIHILGICMYLTRSKYRIQYVPSISRMSHCCIWQRRNNRKNDVWQKTLWFSPVHYENFAFFFYST